MKNHDHKSERRKQRRLEDFGTNHPICLGCLFDDDWSGFEIHHLLGRFFNAYFTWYFCSNCHDWLSERQKLHPKPISKTPTIVEIAGHALLNLADIFALIVWKLQLRRLRHVDQPKHPKSKDTLEQREFGLFIHVLESFLIYVEPQFRNLGIQLIDEANRLATLLIAPEKSNHDPERHP